jgi:HAD superfamily hydrolase (TIGR01662 family)
MRILLWHVHGSWTDAFVRGRHEYLLPVLPAGGPWGLGRAGRDWPASVREVVLAELDAGSIDAVVLQRPEEAAELTRVLGRRPGVDLPAVYVEHNTPKGDVPFTVHPLGEQREIPIVHVTHFNELFWDSGRAPTKVIEHGIADPGYLYTGEVPELGVVVNEPVRRGRVTGTDLLPRFAATAPLQVFGLKRPQDQQDRLFVLAVGCFHSRLPRLQAARLGRMPRSLAQKKYAAFCLGLRWAGNEGDMASDASTLKAVLFDRDGTLVVDVPYNGNAELVRPFPGARKVLDEVRGLGLATGVLSNQSGIARGLLTAEDVDRVNARVEDLLGPFDVWEVCPHGTGDGCVCRKPAPGMIHSACRRLGIDPSEVAFIGDIGSDVQAAAAAGARGVLVPTPQTRAEEVEAAPEVAADLEQAVALLLQGPLLRGPA